MAYENVSSWPDTKKNLKSQSPSTFILFSHCYICHVYSVNTDFWDLVTRGAGPRVQERKKIITKKITKITRYRLLRVGYKRSRSRSVKRRTLSRSRHPPSTNGHEFASRFSMYTPSPLSKTDRSKDMTANTWNPVPSPRSASLIGLFIGLFDLNGSIYRSLLTANTWNPAPSPYCTHDTI